MAVREIKVPWTTQPQEAVDIDWNHPLIQKAKVFAVFDGAQGVVHRPSGKEALEPIYLGRIAPTQDGLAFSQREDYSADQGDYAGWRTVTNFDDINGLTELSAYVLVHSPVISNGAIIGRWGTAANYGGLLTTFNGGEVMTVVATTADTGSWRARNTSGLQAGRISYGFSFKAAQGDLTCVGYLDGKQSFGSNVFSGTVSAIQSVGEKFYLCRHVDNASSNRVTQIPIAVYGSAAWDDETQAEFNRNPWQIFQPASVWIPVIVSSSNVTVTSSALASYFIRVAVGQSATEAYNVRTATGQSATPSYLIRSAVASASAQLFNVRGSVTDSQTETYNIRGSVTQPQVESYLVRGTATSSAVESYLVRGSVTSSAAETFKVRGSVAASQLETYMIRAAASTLASVVYNVRTSAQASRQVLYDVLSSTQVSRSFSVTYNVRTAVASSTGVSYSILQSVTSSSGVSYVVRVATGAGSSQTFVVRGATSKAQLETYNVRTSIDVTRQCTYVINGTVQVTASKRILYSVLSDILPDTNVVYVRPIEQVTIVLPATESVTIKLN